MTFLWVRVVDLASETCLWFVPRIVRGSHWFNIFVILDVSREQFCRSGHQVVVVEEIHSSNVR